MKHLMTFENYQKYSDYQHPRSRWGSPEELKEDAFLTLKKLMPSFEDKWIKSIEDVSIEDKGIKFEAKVGKHTIHVFKVGSSRGQWEFYLNKKKIESSDLKSRLEKENMSDLELFLKYAKSYDFYYQYIDDGGKYRAAQRNNSAIEDRFNKLSRSDKKKANKELVKYFKGAYKDNKIIDRVNSTFKA
jgi:hypothetical protein